MLEAILDDMLEGNDSMLVEKLRKYFESKLDVKPENITKFIQATGIKESSTQISMSEDLKEDLKTNYSEMVANASLNELARKASLFYNGLNKLIESRKKDKSDSFLTDD